MRWISKEKLEEFWSEYFARFPEPGSSAEMNEMRRVYRSPGHAQRAYTRERRKLLKSVESNDWNKHWK